MLYTQRTNSTSSARRTPLFENLLNIFIGGMLQPLIYYSQWQREFTTTKKSVFLCSYHVVVLFYYLLYSMFFCVAVFVLVLRTVLCSIHHLDTEVQHQCKQRCPLQVIVNFCKQFLYKQLWRQWAALFWSCDGLKKRAVRCGMEYILKRGLSVSDRWSVTVARNDINNISLSRDKDDLNHFTM